jgi:hypothetical protein
VVRMLEPAHGAAGVQLQRRCDECEATTDAGDVSVDSSLESGIEQLQNTGSPLSHDERGFFEPRFGAGFASVRIHADAHADHLARELNAEAFTVGHHIAFRSGRYDSTSDAGRHLLAHELTHVVQQTGASQSSSDGRGEAEELDGRIQRLSITQQSLTRGACGARDVRWIFTLGSPAPEDGYIVQQVNNYRFDRGCPPAAGPPAPRPPFWEAWFVARGATNEFLHGRFGYTDSHSRPSAPGTSASEITQGTVKFFKRSVTGDLGSDGVAPAGGANPDWGPGRAPPSASLPSTQSQPSWWNRPEEGPAVRRVDADWDCCSADAAQQRSTITAVP